VEVARLDFVRVPPQSLQVRHAVVAGPGPKYAANSQPPPGPKAARAAAPNAQLVVVALALTNQIQRGVDAVVHIHDSPLPGQPLAIVPPVAGRAAVVHVHQREASAGPIGFAQIERRRGLRSRTTVADDNKGRLLALGGLKV